jgi:hypothetical protein
MNPILLPESADVTKLIILKELQKLKHSHQVLLRAFRRIFNLAIRFIGLNHPPDWIEPSA